MTNQINIIDNIGVNPTKVNSINSGPYVENLLDGAGGQALPNIGNEIIAAPLSMPLESTMREGLRETRVLSNIRRELSNRSNAVNNNLINFLNRNNLSINKIDLPMLFRAMRESIGTKSSVGSEGAENLAAKYDSYFYSRDENSRRRVISALAANNAPINQRTVSFAETTLGQVMTAQNINDGVSFNLIRENIGLNLRNIYTAIFSGTGSVNASPNNQAVNDEVVNLLKRQGIPASGSNIATARQFVFNFVPVNGANINKYNYLQNLRQNIDTGRVLNFAVGKFLAGGESNETPIYINGYGNAPAGAREFIPELMVMSAPIDRRSLNIMRDIFNNMRGVPYSKVLNRDFTLGEIVNYTDNTNYELLDNQNSLRSLGFENTRLNNYAYNALAMNNLPVTAQNIINVKIINRMMYSLGRAESAYVLYRGGSPLDLKMSALMGYINDYRRGYGVSPSEAILANGPQSGTDSGGFNNALYYAINSPNNGGLLNIRNLRAQDILDFYNGYDFSGGNNNEEGFYQSQSYLNQMYLEQLATQSANLNYSQNFYSTPVEELIYNQQPANNYNNSTNDASINYLNQILKTNPHTILWMQANGVPLSLENIYLSQNYEKNMLADAINEAPPVRSAYVGGDLGAFENGKGTGNMLRDAYSYIESLKKTKQNVADIKQMNKIQKLIFFQDKLNGGMVNVPVKAGGSVSNLNISPFRGGYLVNIGSKNFSGVDFYISPDSSNINIYSKSAAKLHFIKDNIEGLQKYFAEEGFEAGEINFMVRR